MNKLLTCSHSNKPSLTDDQVSRGFKIVDITIKSGCETGWVLAPTWEMVNAIKLGKLTVEEFTKKYYELLESRWQKPIQAIEELVVIPRLILVCYCPTGVFCHRRLAANFLVKNLGFLDCGEYSS